MATEYISREAALKEFCDDCMDREWCETYGGSCSRINNINTVPTADVVDVVRGKWLEPDDDYGYLMCSVCEERSPNDERWRFCPNCGADMREVGTDG